MPATRLLSTLSGQRPKPDSEAGSSLIRFYALASDSRLASWHNLGEQSAKVAPRAVHNEEDSRFWISKSIERAITAKPQVKSNGLRSRGILALIWSDRTLP